MKQIGYAKRKNIDLEELVDKFELAMKFQPQKNGEISRFKKIIDFLLENIKNNRSKKGIVFLCIGTDRSTGDCLGPLLGYKIQHLESKNVKVFGTLDEPVHANNLEFYRRIISRDYPDWFVIAIDAAIGDEKDVGTVNIHIGSIQPGAGLGKKLGTIGDISITGVVAPEHLANCLNATRLSKVMKMVDFICEGISVINLSY